MIRRPPRSTRTDTLFPTRRSSDLPRQVTVRDASLKSEEKARRKARPGEETEIGAPTPGLITGLFVQPGDEVEKRSEEHTSELQSLMRISYAVFCLKKKKQKD